MHPATHLLLGWTVAASADLSNRDRALVTAAAMVPDLDAFGFPVERLTLHSETPLLWYSDYHHVLGHNVGVALLATAVALIVSHRRWLTPLFVLLTVHLHLLADIAGGGAADGYHWPVPYLEPFSRAWNLEWSGQWALSSMPNTVLTFALMGVMLYLAWWKGYSPLGLVWKKGDSVFVGVLRQRFGVPGGGRPDRQMR